MDTNHRMFDPIGAFDKLRDNIILYIKTAFGTRYPSLEEERELLLREEEVLSREPWIEVIPKYEADKKISELTLDDFRREGELPPNFDEGSLEDFKTFALCGLIRDDYPLYTHQTEMLVRALHGENLVVTAGTGSGKTESFLLPLLAYLINLSKAWSPPNAKPEHWGDWWRDADWPDQCRNDPENSGSHLRRSYRVAQRGHESDDRPGAVKALILYPMNALVEDQMTRLRNALDSRQSRSWLEDHRNGNYLFFGRYNSETPISGSELTAAGGLSKAKIDKLAKKLQECDDQQRQARDYDRERSEVEDARFLFPSLDGAEMRSRWDMHDCPPDILISNFSMLGVMLMREIDNPVFEATRAWIEEDDRAVFHLIIDELHLYRGTAGTEVAFLIRLLLHRLGLSPNSKKLRILASSASLEPTDDKSPKFLSEFFGNTWTRDQIIEGKLQASAETPSKLPMKDFVALADTLDTKGISDDKICEAAESIASSVDESADGDIHERLTDYFLDSDLKPIEAILSACRNKGGSDSRPVELYDFARRVFGDAEKSSLRVICSARVMR